jgi:hypothetical protein
VATEYRRYGNLDAKTSAGLQNGYAAGHPPKGDALRRCGPPSAPPPPNIAPPALAAGHPSIIIVPTSILYICSTSFRTPPIAHPLLPIPTLLDIASAVDHENHLLSERRLTTQPGATSLHLGLGLTSAARHSHPPLLLTNHGGLVRPAPAPRGAHPRPRPPRDGHQRGR